MNGKIASTLVGFGRFCLPWSIELRIVRETIELSPLPASCCCGDATSRKHRTHLVDEG